MKSWVAGFLHLGNIEVRLKRLEQLRTSSFPWVKKNVKKKREIKCGRVENEKALERTGLRKKGKIWANWKIWNVCVFNTSLWIHVINCVEILLNSWTNYGRMLIKYFIFLVWLAGNWKSRLYLKLTGEVSLGRSNSYFDICFDCALT